MGCATLNARGAPLLRLQIIWTLCKTRLSYRPFEDKLLPLCYMLPFPTNLETRCCARYMILFI